MNEYKQTILCVDDNENILHSLKRLLRKEGYRLLTATNGAEGLKILKENEVHLLISDYRMPGMSGTEFLGKAKEKYPDVLRVILTGYTEVDSITDAINEGHIYKFFLKPWNDENLKLEIKKALEQHDLIQANKKLHEKVLEKNKELTRINENLESLVQERTEDLEIQNQALEFSHVILEELPLPIIGISSEQMIVLINRQAQSLFNGGEGIKLGNKLSEYFSSDMEKMMSNALASNSSQALKGYSFSESTYDIDLIPLSGRFHGRGVIMVLKPLGQVVE